MDESKKDVLHHFVAKSLFLINRARHDINTTVAFLCMRVKSPYQYKWKKLGRMISYLQATQGIKLTLEANDMHVV